MSEIVPDDEPPQRKQKLEAPSCSASAENFLDLADPLSEDDELDSDEEEEYQRQILESDGFDVEWFPRPGRGIFPFKIRDNNTPFDLALRSRLGLHCYNLEKGTNLKLIGVQKFNHEIGTPFWYYITMDAACNISNNNTRCTFQTCVMEHPTQDWGYFKVETQLSRIQIPNGPRATPVSLEKIWREEAIDDFYRGKLPNWLTKSELAAASDKGQYYELQESDLIENEWIHLYAEFAFYLRWRGHPSMESFVPLKIKKVIMQTHESGEEPPNLKLKANNAIFFMSFKCNGDDPSGEPLDYQAIVRKTMDGKPGHIRLEVESWAGKP